MNIPPPFTLVPNMEFHYSFATVLSAHLLGASNKTTTKKHSRKINWIKDVIFPEPLKMNQAFGKSLSFMKCSTSEQWFWFYAACAAFLNYKWGFCYLKIVGYFKFKGKSIDHSGTYFGILKYLLNIKQVLKLPLQKHSWCGDWQNLWILDFPFGNSDSCGQVAGLGQSRKKSEGVLHYRKTSSG